MRALAQSPMPAPSGCESGHPRLTDQAPPRRRTSAAAPVERPGPAVAQPRPIGPIRRRQPHPAPRLELRRRRLPSGGVDTCRCRLDPNATSRPAIRRAWATNPAQFSSASFAMSTSTCAKRHFFRDAGEARHATEHGLAPTTPSRRWPFDHAPKDRFLKRSRAAAFAGAAGRPQAGARAGSPGHVVEGSRLRRAPTSAGSVASIDRRSVCPA